MDSAFTVRSTWGRMSIKTAVETERLRKIIRIELASETLSKSSPKNDVGFFGGIKLGYVFGTGVVRPTIEGDFFYNGFRGGADFTLRDIDNVVLAQRNATTWINTGAFMANFILRFAPGNQKFQPYAGAGVGIYYAESAGVEVNDPTTGTVPINTGGGQVMRTWRGRWSPAQITFSIPSGARLSNTTTSTIQVPRSTRTRVAIWGNTWLAPVCGSFSTNSEQFSPIG